MVKSLALSWTSKIMENASHAKYCVQLLQHDNGLDIYTGLHKCDNDSSISMICKQDIIILCYSFVYIPVQDSFTYNKDFPG